MLISSRNVVVAGFTLFALGLSLAGPAVSQIRRPGADDCVLDRCGAPRDGAEKPAAQSGEPAAPAVEQQRRPSEPMFRRGPTAASGQFDFYLLSLSWSAGFCALKNGNGGGEQCRAGSNLGFVVHGLWPQFDRGFPSDCDPSARAPSRIALDTVKGLFPDEGLARYEWRKHGTCSGKAPADYFADVRFARDKIKIPAEFESVPNEQRVAPADIMRAFQEANPRLRPGMMAVGCTRGLLQEVRLCMTKDLRDFRPCPEVARNSCRSRDISVPAIR